jgi:hypothetical protein
MKNLTEIAEVLDRGGVLVHMANGMMRLRKTERNGMEVSHENSPFIRCESFAPLQSLLSDPLAWSEYHEPPPPPPEPTVAELKSMLGLALKMIDRLPQVRGCGDLIYGTWSLVEGQQFARFRERYKF